MTVKELGNLYDYGYWANRKLFDVIAQLSPEEFTRITAGSYESIRNTMVHVLSAEAGWLDRCGGPKRGPRLRPADYPTAESVRQAWNKVEDNVRGFLARLTDEDLGRNVEFSFDPNKTYSMSLGELMQHAAIHAVHHRGQVALLLRLLGYTPGNFDILFYYAESDAAGVGSVDGGTQ